MGDGGTEVKDGESLVLFNSLVNHVTHLLCESTFPLAPVSRRLCEWCKSVGLVRVLCAVSGCRRQNQSLAGSTMRSDNPKAKALFRHETFGFLFY
jgi:hypothetical protein